MRERQTLEHFCVCIKAAAVKTICPQSVSANISTDRLTLDFCITRHCPAASLHFDWQAFVVRYCMTLREVAPGREKKKKKSLPLVTSGESRSWVGCNECFDSGEMRWRGSVTSGPREAAVPLLDDQRRLLVGGRTGRWMSTGSCKSFILTSFWGVCRHFGGLLRQFCQCKSFSWCVCVPSLSCVYRARPQEVCCTG